MDWTRKVNPVNSNNGRSIFHTLQFIEQQILLRYRRSLLTGNCFSGGGIYWTRHGVPGGQKTLNDFFNNRVETRCAAGKAG